MSYSKRCMAIMLAIVSASGCGTVANLAKPGVTHGGKIPFGGVKHDVWHLDQASHEVKESRNHDDTDAAQFMRGLRTVLYAIDLPLSFVGDVITWPYTSSYTFINEPVPVPPVIHAGGEGIPASY